MSDSSNHHGGAKPDTKLPQAAKPPALAPLSITFSYASTGCDPLSFGDLPY